MDPQASKASLACAIQHAKLHFDWAEFGVARGHTARFLLQSLGDRSLWLFDSYQGLPAPWRQLKRGTFACDQPDLGDPRARYVTGRFEDTVAPWALEHTEPLALVHIDCDLYESARVVLEALRPLLVTGSIIAFDEFESDHGDEEKRAWEGSGIQGTLLRSKEGRTVWRVTA